MPETVRDVAAQQWHAASDHGRDGTPFGGFLCNCEQITKRAIDLGWIKNPNFPTAPNFYGVCETCGNKRCPRAGDLGNKCTGSNAPLQIGEPVENA